MTDAEVQQSLASSKVVVFCIAADERTEELDEAQMVDLLKQNGLQAYTKRAVLPNVKTPANSDFKSVGADFVFKFACTGSAPATANLPKGCSPPDIEMTLAGYGQKTGRDQSLWLPSSFRLIKLALGIWGPPPGKADGKTLNN